MRLLLVAPFALLIQGCASIGVGAFIVTPILFFAFIIFCIWMVVKLISGSSKQSLEEAKFQHQKQMDQNAQAWAKHGARAYTPTLPTPSPAPQVAPIQPQIQIAPTKAKEVVECPYCKEDILKGAIICKHCRSSL